MTKVTDIDITWNKKFPCWCEIRGTELQSLNNVWWLILFLFFLRKIIVDLDMDSRARILVTSECVRYNWADTCQPSILVITSSNGESFHFDRYLPFIYTSPLEVLYYKLTYQLPTLDQGKCNVVFICSCLVICCLIIFASNEGECLLNGSTECWQFTLNRNINIWLTGPLYQHAWWQSQHVLSIVNIRYNYK